MVQKNASSRGTNAKRHKSQVNNRRIQIPEEDSFSDDSLLLDNDHLDLNRTTSSWVPQQEAFANSVNGIQAPIISKGGGVGADIQPLKLDKTVSFDDIGGLSEYINQLKEIEHLAPAILHKLEKFLVHSLELFCLVSDPNTTTPEESLARMQLKAVLLTLVEQLPPPPPPNFPILLLGTSFISPAKLDEESSSVFPLDTHKCNLLPVFNVCSYISDCKKSSFSHVMNSQVNKSDSAVDGDESLEEEAFFINT
ncbi:hypothetical protein LguiB_001865 [Lonicera macranthoides]